MKNPIRLCALALLASPWPLAYAATSVDEHRPANPQGAVEIDNVAGLIDVQGWDKSEVAVTGTIGKDVERVDVTGDGNRTSIRVLLPKGMHWNMNEGEAHLVIHVPTNSSVSASMVSSDLKISAVHGALELRTVSGNISGDGGGDLRANDVSGDIRFTAMAAKRIEVKAISGSIVLTGGNTDIEATTVSGDVRLTLGTVSHARFKSVSGGLSATLAAAADEQIDGERRHQIEFRRRARGGFRRPNPQRRYRELLRPKAGRTAARTGQAPDVQDRRHLGTRSSHEQQRRSAVVHEEISKIARMRTGG